MIDALGLEWADFDTEDSIGVDLTAALKVKEYNGVFSNEIDKLVAKV